MIAVVTSTIMPSTYDGEDYKQRLSSPLKDAFLIDDNSTHFLINLWGWFLLLILKLSDGLIKKAKTLKARKKSFSGPLSKIFEWRFIRILSYLKHGY